MTFKDKFGCELRLTDIQRKTINQVISGLQRGNIGLSSGAASLEEQGISIESIDDNVLSLMLNDDDTFMDVNAVTYFEVVMKFKPCIIRSSNTLQVTEDDMIKSMEICHEDARRLQ